MFSALYYLIIYPIELLLEVCFSIIFDCTDNHGLAIIGVSIAINLLLLPLYNRADAVSILEREKQKNMQPWVNHIRQSFSGDERFMMLQTYYRKQGYHPLQSLRSSISLLLEIPFFIAAYHFLSNLSRLKGASFLWIKDLGLPDGIVVIPAIGFDVSPSMVLLPGFNVNVLPIFMTLVNLISIIIYTKDSPFREKLQLYIMALLFLVLLYKSPSGLVVYWTMNNIFSLVKNIVLKISGSKHNMCVEKKPQIQIELPRWLFLLGAALLTLILGILIPSSVVVSSPSEFVIKSDYKDPLQYVFFTLLIVAGIFIVWLPVFYYLASDKAKRIICIGLWLCSGIAIIDFFLFGRFESYISPEMKYDIDLSFPIERIMLNIILLVAVGILMIIVAYRRRGLLKPIYGILIAGVALVSIINMIQTERVLGTMPYLKSGTDTYEGFTISKKGKNVGLFRGNGG